MINDTSFLCNSSLNYYFNFSANSDPFLLGITNSSYDINGLMEDKITIPVSSDMLESIKHCQTILVHECIIDEMVTRNKSFIQQPYQDIHTMKSNPPPSSNYNCNTKPQSQSQMITSSIPKFNEFMPARSDAFKKNKLKFK